MLFFLFHLYQKSWEKRLPLKEFREALRENLMKSVKAAGTMWIAHYYDRMDILKYYGALWAVRYSGCLRNWYTGLGTQTLASKKHSFFGSISTKNICWSRNLRFHNISNYDWQKRKTMRQKTLKRKKKLFTKVSLFI